MYFGSYCEAIAVDFCVLTSVVDFPVLIVKTEMLFVL